MLVKTKMRYHFFCVCVCESYLFSAALVFAACGLPLVTASGATILLRCEGYSSQWLLLLPSTGSRVPRFLQLRCMGSVVMVHWLSCPGACGIFLDQGLIEPTSPALQGRFFFFSARTILNHWTNKEAQDTISHPLGWLSSKQTNRTKCPNQKTSVGEDAEKLEPLYTASRNEGAINR